MDAASPRTAILKALPDIATPAYVADIAALKRNMQAVDRIKAATGCKILLATKAFAQFSAFAPLIPHLDGTTASGYYEARLGYEKFGKEVHVYSPAFTERDIADILPYASHIYFNSAAQLARFAPEVRRYHGDKAIIGLRINPGISLTGVSGLYDPSAPGSRFGIPADQLHDDLIAQADLLHVHNLCENPAADSVKLINHIIDRFGAYISRKNIRYINLGGGHYMNEPGYDIDALITGVNRLQDFSGARVILEPGGALARKAGYLVASVLDIIRNGDTAIAVLDASATCHMPDVLELPYRPEIIGAGEGEAFPHRYELAGNTCMTGDRIGSYGFAAPLTSGDKVVFTCMAQYALVKNTQFNGVPLPDIGILKENGGYKKVKSFGYTDFVSRLS